MKEPEKRREPGNRAGAVGLLLGAAGVGCLMIEIPPTLLQFSDPMAWVLLVAGSLLALAGLWAEWRGPRRWSALLPAAVVVGLVGLGVALAARSSVVAYAIESVLDAPAYVPRAANLSTAVVVAFDSDGDPTLARLTARALARRGVAAVAVPSADATALLRAVAELRPLAGNDSAVGLWGYGSAALTAVEAAAGSAEIDFVVWVSGPADERELQRLDRPFLGIYGTEDTVTEGLPLRNARRVSDALSRGEAPPTVIRIFLGADDQIRVPASPEWLAPARFATSFLDIAATWMVSQSDDRARLGP